MALEIADWLSLKTVIVPAGSLFITLWPPEHSWLEPLLLKFASCSLKCSELSSLVPRIPMCEIQPFIVIVVAQMRLEPTMQ